MPLQVIAGVARGRRLKSPPAGVRPTAAITKRSLFDILGPRIEGARVLDLYAGSGALGIEALSRGAAECDFVDRDRRCVAVIRANLEAIREATGGRPGRVDCAPADRWLERHAASGGYDLVLADPPYGDPGLTRAMTLLAEPGALAVGGWLVVEARTSAPPVVPDGLTEVRSVRHGDSTLTILAAS
ncbi:MAG: rRNA (guanine966-N2)-methyltransferase [Chloroflexota bacterium]|nr:rRNA (guanine966-N2)-methyltransferase [Chloroflexota bacterium]